MPTSHAASRVLPPKPRSASIARHFVTDVCAGWQEHDAGDVAALLVTELVTNAVLHAGSPITVTAHRRPPRLRIEVADDSPVNPTARHHDVEATTGRGLDLVTALAEEWGVEPDAPAGKIVWFEVSAAGTTADVEHQAASSPSQESGPPPTGHTEVQLLEAPVRLLGTMQQHTEALVRELTLFAFDEESDGAGLEGMPLRLDVDLGELDRQVRAATEAGQSTADVVVSVPAGSAATVAEARALLDNGDELADDERLLCPPALPEVADCRRWFLQQLVDQLEGRPAAPWRPEPVVTDDEAITGEKAVGVDAGAVLDHLTDAVVAADARNRITYVNHAGEELLGWPADELVGERVTAIVPARLRHAHIAGYTRYLVTGRRRLIGTTIRVPIQHRDGSEVEVEMTLAAFPTGSGRTAFSATLRNVAPQAVGDRSAETIVATARSALRTDTGGSAEERRVRLLATLAEHLGCEFAAWWRVEGDTLHCTSPWRQQARLDPFVAASKAQQFASGVGLPGRVWAARAPAWIADLVADANIPRKAVALEAGLRSGAAFPLIDGDQTLGVVELLTTEVRHSDQGLLAALAELGRLLGTSEVFAHTPSP